MAEVRETTPRRYIGIRFDDGLHITVPRKVAENAGAGPGMTLLPQTIKVLLDAEARAAELLAIRRLGRADRTEKELREYLASRGFSAQAIDGALQPLLLTRAIDDSRTAEYHVGSRSRGQAKSRRMLRAELRQRGVASDAVDEAVDAVDDDEGARRVLQRRLGRAPTDSYRAFEAYLGPFLMRRGFGYDTASRVMRDAWDQARSGDEGIASD